MLTTSMPRGRSKSVERISLSTVLGSRVATVSVISSRCRHSMPRRALEYHFARGDLAIRDRLPNFQRVYDLPERVLPDEHLDC